MVASRMDDVTAALIALWTEQAGLTGVSVYDGPAVSASADRDLIMIGDDADPDSDVSSTFVQEWANFSHTRRSETGEIPCAVIAQSGSTALAARRTRAFELLAECELAVLADPTLGDVTLAVEMISGSARPVQNSRGAAIIVPFTVRYWTQL